ncbi:MAG TPA: TIGR01777 family oxidoreductase [Burkholderiales bacterium]
MEVAYTLLAAQGILGAWDNLWNHEYKVGLARRAGARAELVLHALRAALYAPVFVVFAWLELTGWYAAVFAGLLATEIAITLLDFVEEDRSRELPANERVLHTVLAINFGAFLAVLVPQLWLNVQQPTAAVVMDRGIWSWLFSVFALGTAAWSLRDAIAAFRNSPPDLATWQRRQLAVRRCVHPKVILVAGGTGFVGRHLCWRLIEKGHRVIVLARDRAKAVDLFGSYARPIIDLKEIRSTQRVDAIVNLAGEPIAGWWWTAWRKALLVESRVGMTRMLLDWAQARGVKPAVLVNASAVGWYGARGDEPLDESAHGGDDFPARLCRAWEREALVGGNIGIRVVTLRLGLVLGHGGLLARLLPTFGLGLGAPFGRGNQWMPWIHIDDAVDIFALALRDVRLSGQVNAVAPQPVTNRQFSQLLARTLRRPLWPAIPAVVLRTVLGELATLFVDGQRVLPVKLIGIGHRFRHPALSSAFSDLIGREGSTSLRTASDHG